MKLIDYIRMESIDGKISIPCEVNPQHMTTKYVRVVFEKMMLAKDVSDAPVMVTIDLRVCPVCFTQYCYDVSKIGSVLSVT